MVDYKTLRKAIDALILADGNEVASVIHEYPVLLTSEAMKIIRNIIARFEKNVTVVDEIPARWIERVKVLEGFEKGKVHETDVGAGQ